MAWVILVAAGLFETGFAVALKMSHGMTRIWPTAVFAACALASFALLPEARGVGHGTQAQRLLARYLFAHTTAHRIIASTEVTNRAERRALEKAGFTAEGIARGVGWRDGQWRDGVTYSLLRADPPA